MNVFDLVNALVKTVCLSKIVNSSEFWKKKKYYLKHLANHNSDIVHWHECFMVEKRIQK